jgi:hypothetical protein
VIHSQISHLLHLWSDPEVGQQHPLSFVIGCLGFIDHSRIIKPKQPIRGAADQVLDPSKGDEDVKSEKVSPGLTWRSNEMVV